MSIIVEDLEFTYMRGCPYEKVALNKVSLKITEGEFVGIIGHTGSGKSTLIQHFNGLLKPTSGKVIIQGVDVMTKNLQELRKHVGIIFQYPEHQLFEETVYKDIAFGLIKLGLSEDERDKRIREIIYKVGLSEEVLDKSPFELSGGQKRRVAIAGVLVMNPKILILDEPTAGLDPSGRDGVFKLIRQLYEDLKITVVLVSHSMEDIARLVSRVIVMNKGNIVLDGPTSDIFKKTEELEKIGLSAPQITYLMKRMNAVFPGINGDLFTVEQAKKEIVRYLKANQYSFPFKDREVEK